MPGPMPAVRSLPSAARRNTRFIGLFGTLVLVSLAISLPARGAVPATSPTLAEARELRVQAILRRILIANQQACSDRQSDHGLVVGAPMLFPGGAPVIAVLPGSAAEAAGLRRGDLVRAVNGTPWSPDSAETAAFARALSETGRAPDLALVIERDDQKLAMVLTGEPACRAEARLSPSPTINATAVASTVIVDSGLEALLPDDAELAFAVAHEAGHVILGHTAPEQRSAIGDRPHRQAMERAADALALHLMARAGYDPAAAPAAWVKIADASRPPLHRLMDLHGPYMATAERTVFLANEAARLDRPDRMTPSRSR